MHFSGIRRPGDHLDGMRRGGAFVACVGAVLLFVWSWTAHSPTASSDIRSVVARAADIANAPSTISRPWLPVALAIQPVRE